MVTPLEFAADAEDYREAFDSAREQAAAIHSATPPASLPQWVVLGPGTSDHPGMYLARLWLVRPNPRPTAYLLRAASLDEVRRLLPPGLTCLPRFADDEPNILEVWF